MKFLLVIASLLFTLPAILCITCSESSYGKYDESSRESTRDEKNTFGWWNIPQINRRLIERKSVEARKECPELYQRYSVDHTFCKEASDDVVEQGVTDEDKKIILNFHNELRSKLASGEEARYTQLPSAANMMQMEWDDELEAVAQAHSNLCKFEHDRGDQRAVENFGVGQNLLKSSSLEKHWKSGESWYKEEVCFFSPEDINPFTFQKSYGHFSQVAWANTWKIGCGFTACQGSKTMGMYSCNYGPGGNVKSSTMYIEGEPCSQCPENTECSSEYPGLCKSLTEDGPQIARPSADEYILFCDFSDKDPEECNNVKVEGSKSFSTRHIYSGDYKTVVLEGGEHMSINLGEAQNTGGFCPFIYGRFGPNNAKDSMGAEMEIDFGGTSLTLESNGPRFSTLGVHMMYDGKLSSTINLRANDGAAPQYFDIKYWGIRKGDCKTGL